jgi:general secretion pathway protein I
MPLKSRSVPVRACPPLPRRVKSTAAKVPALRGFTLIEALVALAITAIALAAGVKASSVLVGNAERQSTMLLAQICAENALVQVRLQRQMPTMGESSFSCEQAGRRFDGKLLVRATANPLFMRVDAQILQSAGHTAASGVAERSPAQPQAGADISLLRMSTVVGRL